MEKINKLCDMCRWHNDDWLCVDCDFEEEKKMATAWNSQVGGGKFAIQFETQDGELYEMVEKVCQIAMDLIELEKLREDSRYLREELNGVMPEIERREMSASTCGAER